MFKLILFIIISVTYNISFANSWQLIKDENNIQVYKRSLNNTSLVSFKGIGIVNARYDKVLQVILDPNRAKTWGKDLKESKILKWIDKPLEFVEYNEIEMPAFINNRDFVSKIKITIDTGSKIIKVNYIKDKSYIFPIKEDNVLGDVTGSYFTVSPVQNGKKTKLVGVAIADPKGLIPHWVVNLFQSDWAYETIMGIKEQLRKKELKSHPDFKNILD